MGAVGAGVQFQGRKLGFGLYPVADFLDWRRDDRRGIFGVAEFQVHTAADVLHFQHGASPSGAGDGNVHGLRAELGMAGKQCLAAAEKHGSVTMMHGLDFQDGGWWKIVEKHPAFDFRLNDAAVDFVREVGVRAKHTGLGE